MVFGRDGLEERLTDCAAALGEGLNVQSVSQGVVLPVLKELDWDVFDTGVVRPAYAKGDRCVDFALCGPPSKPHCFIGVGELGAAIDPKRTLEVAKDCDVPLVVLTDGATWSFYLSGESGSGEDSCVGDLDLRNQDESKSAETLRRYLADEHVLSGAALENAREDYSNKHGQRIAKNAIPGVWERLLAGDDELAMDAIAQAVERNKSVQPDPRDVAEFLRAWRERDLGDQRAKPIPVSDSGTTPAYTPAVARSTPDHPGVVLRQQFLDPLKLSVADVAKALNINRFWLQWIVSSKAKVASHTALRLSRYFGTTPEYWLDLQARYDLARTRASAQAEIEREVEPSGTEMASATTIEVRGGQVGLVRFGPGTSAALRECIAEQLAVPPESRSVWPTALPAAGAATALTPLLTSGNVFLATAAPSSLMTIGGGVSSAVMHGGRIVAHAPFVAASSALVPVVLPVVLLMTFSAMATSARFDRLQATVDQLAVAVRELLKRDYCDDLGLLLSAHDRLQDLGAEFDESHFFTDDMTLRLAHVEGGLGPLVRKYEVLLQAKLDSAKAGEIETSALNQRIYALATMAMCGVDRLRLKLAIQNSPSDFERRILESEKKHDEYLSYFQALADENQIEEAARRARKAHDDMNWLTCNFWGRDVARGHEEVAETAARVMRDLKPFLDRMVSLAEEQARMTSATHSVLYLSDENTGKLKAYSGDFGLSPARALEGDRGFAQS